MNFPKACKILGINESSNLDAETVRKQYKMMALKYHPDKNPDNEEVTDPIQSLASPPPPLAFAEHACMCMFVCACVCARVSLCALLDLSCNWPTSAPGLQHFRTVSFQQSRFAMDMEQLELRIAGTGIFRSVCT